MASRAEAGVRTVGELCPAPLPGAELVCAPWRRMIDEKHAWDELARRAAEPNPFFESWYLLPSLENFDGGGTASVLCFIQDGELCGLLPIIRQQEYEGWPLPHIGNWLHPNIFYAAPLVAPRAEVQFWRAVLDWADGNPGFSLFLHLDEIALDGPVYAALESVLAA